MRKCVKIILSGFNDIASLYQVLKKKVQFNAVEGIAQVSADDQNEAELILYGPKEAIDDIVESIDMVAMKEEIDMSVEPFLKEEDFRGVFRFIQKA